MRAIKFRAFDTKDSRYFVSSIASGVVYADLKIGLDGRVFSHGMMPPHDEKKRFIIEQFTGLRDKSGVEIYEGDIVKTVGLYKQNFAVEWESRSFELFDGKDGILSDEHNYWKEYEVVGNIHENPEMLKP